MLASLMSSGPGGAVDPISKILPELKELAKKIISELPPDWNDETILRAVLDEQGSFNLNDL